MQRARKLAMLLAFGLIVVMTSVAGRPIEVTFVSKPLNVREGAMPSCTPVEVSTQAKKVFLADLNNVWGTLTLSESLFAALPRFDSFDQCVAQVAEYDGRYTEEHLIALSNGELAVTMPFEFALMVLGPAPREPSVLHKVNPFTKRPEAYTNYVWISVFGKMGRLHSGFRMAGGGAPVSNTFPDLDTTNLVTWSLKDLSDMKIIKVEVDQRNQINLLGAQ